MPFKPLLRSFALAAPLLAAVPAVARPGLTVYNGDFGVVRESLALDLRQGSNQVRYSGVTRQLEPESVVLRDPSGEVKFRVSEQSYRGDPVDQDRLLRMFEGETIEFLKRFEDAETVLEGRIVRAPSEALVATESGQRTQRLQPIVEVDGALRAGLPGTPLFPELKDDSVLRPTLSWKIHAPEQASLDARLSYLTRGLSWKSDYNLVLPPEGDDVSLTGWVSIRNRTGKTFDDADIKLIAGDVHKVREKEERPRAYAAGMARAVANDGPRVTQKKFDAFHLYALPEPTALRDGETKQVEFVRAESVPTRKLYVYDGAQVGDDWRRGGTNTSPGYGANANSDVAVYREFENREANNLGMPLPAGRIRFYRADGEGRIEFVGEDRIDHTPKNETVRAYVGNAFDLVGERKRTDFERAPNRDMLRERFAIEIRNRSEEAVKVRVVEHLYRGANWEIVETSRDFEKADARTIEFPVTVDPDATRTVDYTVEYRW